MGGSRHHDAVATVLAGVSDDDATLICSAILDAMQFDSNLGSRLDQLELTTDDRQGVADAISSCIVRLLQSRSGNTNYAQILGSLGVPAALCDGIAQVIAGRIDEVCKVIAAKSIGGKLVDLEWRFGVTAGSNTGQGAPFVQMRLQFEKQPVVTLEMGMHDFYDFAGSIRTLQQQMGAALGL